ncbi:MAG: 5,10-methylenetetrahydrofolate reductase [Armatimonadetes bacterium CG_4_10_14_3_um_filter_66_18]|nr:methylenetetrahydrofolate reductase [Armatimonadota bacterium]PIU90809.1 MAG: 5,10-methylenetetrahydrofolate reductase [Armatimonadetes bacterium CG06_land_8_20_14_3_00_66_21]PIX50135.1 MAG: 5,10-methylenetetrahydrofolate reductase [Armatimonadetes bacterium CG_4_8_14_3_um_filter_66_20]PIY45248.1 MAG: 5,10-methylenetetrahydrofolate reductase [Armatimonadetes bacterium CG_4_10_14_3_um_filter_66_18]PIZ45703.1 MAG: 5,10-methylenetetrahydrofolate reductase [Armatimonadetes bacterium CG_4_10_14_0
MADVQEAEQEVTDPASAAGPVSKLDAALKAGEFVVSVEVVPPRIPSFAALDKVVEAIESVAVGVNVTDFAGANVRISGAMVCKYLLEKGVEPIFQMTCRDRNRLAMQGDLLGLLAQGLRNVFCVSGDYISLGDHPEAKAVYDIDSVNLIKMYNDMRTKGVFANGDLIRETPKTEHVIPKFCLGGACNPFADPFEFRVDRLAKKAAAGADFVQTQCIFDLDRFERFMKLVCERGLHKQIKIIGGVMPCKSHRPLLYMRDNVPGVRIPDEVIKRLEGAEDKKAEGVNIAVETVQRLRNMEGVAGIHIMTLSWEEVAPILVERAGLDKLN